MVETPQDPVRPSLPAAGTDRVAVARPWRIWLIAAVVAAAVYLPTMAPGVLWGDSGEAQIRVLTGALCDAREIVRSHVTYYALAIGLHRLSGCDAAWAANLISALGGIITVANVALLIAHLVRDRIARVCGVGLLLLSHTLWQMSAGAEVVTSATAFLSLELLLAVRFLHTCRLRWLVLLGLANGLSWSTHNFAMLMWPCYLLLLVARWPKVPQPRVRSLGWVLVAWLIGCLPLIVQVILEYQRLGDAVATIRSLLVGIYGSQVLNTRVGLGALAQVLGFVVMNFPTPLLLLAAWGWWQNRSERTGVWLLLSSAGLLFFVFAFRYRVPDRYTFFVPFYLVLVGFAAQGIERWFIRFDTRAMRLVVLVLSGLAPLAYALGPPLLRQYGDRTLPFPKRVIPYRDPYGWFLRPWRAGYRGPERYAREVLSSLPPNAVLLSGPTAWRPMEYLQRRDGMRPDVRVCPLRVTRPAPNDEWVYTNNAAKFIDQNRLFTVTHEAPQAQPWLLEGSNRFEPFGHVYRVLPAAGSAE